MLSLLVVKSLKISIYDDNKLKKFLEQVLHVHHPKLSTFRGIGLFRNVYLMYGLGFASLRMYKGCLGSPLLLVSKQCNESTNS